MRKKFILYVLIPLAILIVVTSLFIDRWVEAGLERLGEELVGARVEIDDLHLSLSPLAIRFDRMQVANPRDPWNNVFETRRVRFAMDFAQLLRNKYIIETVEINELILGTPRSTDGSLPEGRRRGGDSFVGQAARMLESSVRQAPVFDPAQLRRLFNVDSLLDIHALQSVRHLDSMKQVVQNARQQWESARRDFEESRQAVKRVEASVRAIKADELKTVEGVTAAIAAVQDARKTVNTIAATYTARRDSAREVMAQVTTGVGAIDDVIRQDFDRVLRLARLPNLDARSIAELLLGKEIFRKSADVLHWVDVVRASVKKYKPKPEIEVPRRMEGQEIHFPAERAYPKFWIRNVRVSGGAGRREDSTWLRVKGELHDISNNQTVTGKPITAALEGEHGSGIALSLGALIDRRAAPLDEYRASVRGLRLPSFEFGQSDFLPARISDMLLAAETRIRVPEDRFGASGKLAFDNVRLAFAAEPRNTLERVVRNVLGSVRQFNAGLEITGGAAGFNVGLSTDLDTRIAAGLRDVAGAEVARLQADLRAGINKRVAASRADVERRAAEYTGSVRNTLGAVDTLIASSADLVNARTKDLEQRLEKLKKEEVGKTLEGILKRRK